MPGSTVKRGSPPFSVLNCSPGCREISQTWSTAQTTWVCPLPYRKVMAPSPPGVALLVAWPVCHFLPIPIAFAPAGSASQCQGKILVCHIHLAVGCLYKTWQRTPAINEEISVFFIWSVRPRIKVVSTS